MSAPLFLVHGTPTPAELAAVIAVLSARGSGSAAEPPRPRRSLWATPVLPGPLTPGPDVWRTSALPR